MKQGLNASAENRTAAAAKRDRAINAVRRFQAGQSVQEIVRQECVDQSTVYRWIARYGQTAKKDTGIGHPTPGRPPLLSESQKEQIYSALVNDRTPWSIPRVITYVVNTFGKTISKPTAWRILQSLSLTPEPSAAVTALEVLKSPSTRELSRQRKLRPQIIRLAHKQIHDDCAEGNRGANNFSDIYVSIMKGKQQYQFCVFRSRKHIPSQFINFYLEEAVKGNLVILSYDSLPILSAMDTEGRIALRSCFVCLKDELSGCIQVVNIAEHLRTGINQM